MRSIRSTQPQLVLEINTQAECLSLRHSETGTRRLNFYNAGFLRQRQLRRILSLASYKLCIGRPKAKHAVVVWGHSQTAYRGQWVTQKQGASLIRIEDAFLRFVRTGRDGDPPLGLVLDSTGCHFDASKLSDLEHMLQHHPLDDPHLIERATAATRRIQHSHLSKYNTFEPTTAPSVTDYVLVIDQTFNDAALRTSGANAAQFH
jgi:capsular polysaccharide export protein